jgi:hypothetical protein
VYQLLSTFPHSILLCPHPMSIHMPICPILQHIFLHSGPLCMNPDILSSTGGRPTFAPKSPDCQLVGSTGSNSRKTWPGAIHHLDTHPQYAPILITTPTTLSFGTQSPLPCHHLNRLMQRCRMQHPPPLPQPHRRAPPEDPQPPGTLCWWDSMYRSR